MLQTRVLVQGNAYTSELSTLLFIGKGLQEGLLGGKIKVERNTLSLEILYRLNEHANITCMHTHTHTHTPTHTHTHTKVKFCISIHIQLHEKDLERIPILGDGVERGGSKGVNKRIFQDK